VRFPFAARCVLALALGAVGADVAVAAERTVDLVVDAGTPLRVALDQRVRVKRIGQAVTGTVVEPVYAFDRIVVPAGSRVVGHFERLEPPSKGARVRSMLGGDFSPPRKVVISFNTLVRPDGQAFPIDTVVTGAADNLSLQVAGESGSSSVVARARREIAQKAKGAVASVKKRGRMGRAKRWLRDTVLGLLPLHPQYLREDTVYNVKLVAPLGFGPATATAQAPEGTAPAPGSILTARLVTPLNSATSTPSTRIEAVVTRPVLSADGGLILPEGTRLAGEVTFAKRARRFHRNGQLRVLFESGQPPDRGSEKLLASLHSVESGAGRLSLDEEGGASVASSDARFVAPALASLALAATFRHKLDYDTDGAGPEVAYGSTASSGAGGFFGLGLLGAGVAQAWRPAAVGLAIVGVARTLYASVAGKGQDISFPADTPIQVRLAPGPSPAAGPSRGPEPRP